MSETPDDVVQLLATEAARVEALLGKDMPRLAAMLEDSLVHVHATGRVEDREAYLAGVRDNLEFHSIDRGPLTVRVFGDVAIMTGSIGQRLRVLASGADMELSSLATQVWVRSGEGWQLASFHACPCR